MKSLRELQNLDGRVALITGGAGHLGRMFAEVAAELQAKVILVDRDPSVFAAADEISEEFGVLCEGLEIDLSDRAAVSLLPGSVAAKHGRLDILVNNAAFTGASNLKGWAVPFEEQGIEAWQAAHDVNLLAPFLLTQKAAPFLAKNRIGSVVNVASIYGVAAPDFRLYDDTSMGNPAAYNASKGALIQLSRYLSTALAPHVRVNSISPGGIRRGQPERFAARYVQKVPLERMAVEEDFKGVAQLLISDLGAYITGQNIIVDGGWTVW